MIEYLPFAVSVAFLLTTLLTLILFYQIAKTSKIPIIIMVGIVFWLSIIAILASQGFYTNTSAMPPRLLLAIIPPLFVILLLFTTRVGRHFIDNLPLKSLLYLHIVRIPVELILYCLFVNKALPELMTFSGRNYDILAGITAPIVIYGYAKQKMNIRWVLIWNLTTLILLINIMINAMLSAPFPFQQFAFEQPNIAVLYFPFIWLPTCIVPMVLFAHLASIRQILKLAK